ncbi:MAG: Na/Pi cotransporter family protein [Spirochaetes bacterium]|jgi:phosphate:Na+ symporter|nr:Na/Pi cotransporter family protein [Spirochaetota bacterium]
MDVIADFLRLAGSLGLFLYGMRVMSDGLQRTAGERLQRILDFMAGNRVVAMLTGFLITAMLQSSSATTVLLVGFVNAGLLSLVQAVGVILGANVGTTLTGWIVALLGFTVDISGAALPAIALGAIFYFVRRFKRPELGRTIIGFGLLFLGLMFLGDSVPDAEEYPRFLEFTAAMAGPGLFRVLVFVGIGTLLTVMLQSSSAAMAVTITMAYAGWIDYRMAAAIILGENIGTTITATLAALGGSVTARRTARAHVMFNLVGVLWMLAVFEPALRLVDIIVPGAAVDASLATHLAVFHSMFNIANALLFLGFTPRFAALVERLVPDRPEPDLMPIESTSVLRHLEDYMHRSPGLYLYQVRNEVSRMANQTGELYDLAARLVVDPSQTDETRMREAEQLEELIDRMREEISHFLAACSSEDLSLETAEAVTNLLRITQELERIADSSYNLCRLAERARRKDRSFSRSETEELREYVEVVARFLRFTQRNLNEILTPEELEAARSNEAAVDNGRASLKRRARKRLEKHKDVRSELLLIDIAGHLEHIGDFCMNIAEAHAGLEKQSRGALARSGDR